MRPQKAASSIKRVVRTSAWCEGRSGRPDRFVACKNDHLWRQQSPLSLSPLVIIPEPSHYITSAHLWEGGGGLTSTQKHLITSTLKVAIHMNDWIQRRFYLAKDSQWMVSMIPFCFYMHPSCVKWRERSYRQPNIRSHDAYKACVSHVYA